MDTRPRNIHGDGEAIIAYAKRNTIGFLNSNQVAAIASDTRTRLTPILVRCGACRFVVPADQCQHLIDIITREGSDHVRDVALVAERIG